MNLKTLAIAIVAGLACVLLISAAGTAGTGALFLMLVAPMPIYMAAFGWGTSAAVVASLTAIIGTGIAVSPNSAVVTGLMFSIPASIIGHQANLAQSDDTGKLEWFPLPQLFFNLCFVVAACFAAMLIYFGYDDTKAAALPVLSEAIGQITEQNPVFDQFNEEDIANLKVSTFNMMPFWISGLWLIIHCLNITFSAFLCRLSGLMPRPRDDIAAGVRLPVAAIGILFVALLIAFLTAGKLQYYSGAFLGTFLTAFSLVGLAMLHERARSSGAHFFLLMLSYALILFIYLPMFVFAGAGILRTFKQTNLPPAPPRGNQT